MKILKIILTIILLCSIYPYYGNGQETGKGTIRGIVKDSESGDPLIGVNIVVLGTYLGSSSDADGFFVIPNVKNTWNRIGNHNDLKKTPC